MTSIGIHLGNTSACIAVNKSGKVNVVANTHGDRITPSMVTISPEEVSVGFSSKQSCHRFPKSTIRHANLLLGKRSDESGVHEVIDHIASNTGLNIENNKGTPVYNVKNGQKEEKYEAKDVVTMILKNVFDTAQNLAGSDVNEAVITAPVGYLPGYRDSLVDAASVAGFEVLRVIAEPAAAALAYGFGVEDRTEDKFHIVVFRLGGITQDVTILKVWNGLISIVDYEKKDHGGDKLTEDIANHFAGMFERENKIKNMRENEKSMMKLMRQAEICKHVLSTMPTASCHIDSLFEGRDYNGSLSRSRFEMLVSDDLMMFMEPIKEVLARNSMTPDQVKSVILSGGSSSIPKLQDAIAKFFPQSDVLSKIPPAEVLAFGASVESGFLINLANPELAEEDYLLSVSPVNIYLDIFDKKELLLHSGTILPSVVDKEYLRPEDKELCPLHLTYSQNHSNSSVLLTEISLEDKSVGKCVKVHLKYFDNGHLLFSCTNTETGHTKSVTIS